MTLAGGVAARRLALAVAVAVLHQPPQVLLPLQCLQPHQHRKTQDDAVVLVVPVPGAEVAAEARPSWRCAKRSALMMASTFSSAF